MMVWDLISSIALIIACIMTPWTLAFEVKGSRSNTFFECADFTTCSDLITDFIFMAEILIVFNTSFLVSILKEQYELSRCKIAKKYLKGWFIVDFIAILPRFINVLFLSNSDSGAGILGIMKFARISRIIKLLRLAKIIKAAKVKEGMGTRMKAQNASVAIERITVFSIISLLMIHTVSCLQIYFHREIQPDGNIASSEEATWIVGGGL